MHRSRKITQEVHWISPCSSWPNVWGLSYSHRPSLLFLLPFGDGPFPASNCSHCRDQWSSCYKTRNSFRPLTWPTHQQDFPLLVQFWGTWLHVAMAPHSPFISLLLFLGDSFPGLSSSNLRNYMLAVLWGWALSSAFFSHFTYSPWENPLRLWLLVPSVCQWHMLPTPQLWTRCSCCPTDISLQGPEGIANLKGSCPDAPSFPSAMGLFGSSIHSVFDQSGAQKWLVASFSSRSPCPGMILSCLFFLNYCSTLSSSVYFQPLTQSLE